LVKAGEYFFIVNEEDKFIHNVYDMDDESWILKKQEPSGIAAIKFDEAGTHAIRCAIHPTMKTLIKVEAE
jgi:plastocyanin